MGPRCEGGERRSGMYIMGENPGHLRPGCRARRALVSGARILVGADLFLTETARYADVVLPARVSPEDGTFGTPRPYSAPHQAVARRGRRRRTSRSSVDRRTARTQERASRPRKSHRGNRAGDAVVARRDLSRLEGAGTAVPGADGRLHGNLVPLRRPVPTADGKGIFVPVGYAPPVESTRISVVMNTGAAVSLAHGTMTRRASGRRPREPTPTSRSPRRRARARLEDGDLSG